MADLVMELAGPIQLADLVVKAADEAQSFKQECQELKAKTEKLAGLLRQVARNSNVLYQRPTRRITDDTEQVLDKTLVLVNKCRANGIIKRVFTIIPAAAFRKTSMQLENSLGDVSWLLRVSSSDDHDDEYLGLPPIASNEPILCLIWEQVAILYTGSLEEKSDAAASLVSLARDNDRYGKLIIEEGGVPPLLKLAKEGEKEALENAARALGLLGRDPESVEQIVNAGVCSVFAKILKDGHMKVQSVVAWAVSELVDHHPKCQDHFAQNNIVRFLVSHLAFETVQEHSKYAIAKQPLSIHSVVVANNTNNPNDYRMFHDGDDTKSRVPHPMGSQAPNAKQNSVNNIAGGKLAIDFKPMQPQSQYQHGNAGPYQHPNAGPYQHPNAGQFQPGNASQYQHPNANQYQHPNASQFQHGNAGQYQHPNQYQLPDAGQFQQGNASQYQHPNANQCQHPNASQYQHPNASQYQHPNAIQFQLPNDAKGSTNAAMQQHGPHNGVMQQHGPDNRAMQKHGPHKAVMQHNPHHQVQVSLSGTSIKGRESIDPAIKAEMKAMAARALWKLSKGNVSISRNLTESRALLCFAVLLEKGPEDVQSYSAMALMEITAVAEQNADLRRSAFKPTSPAAKAVLEQLLIIIEKANSELLIPCIKAIGNLARTFRATETRIIGPLVKLLDETEPEVSMEAIIALNKFATTENYLCDNHSKAIINAGGTKHLIQLVYFGEQMVQIPALILLCFVSLNVPDSETLAEEEVLIVLEWSLKQAHLAGESSIDSLLPEATSRLKLYQSRGTRGFH